MTRKHSARRGRHCRSRVGLVDVYRIYRRERGWLSTVAVFGVVRAVWGLVR